jgi:hypothetical protein
MEDVIRYPKIDIKNCAVIITIALVAILLSQS